MHVVSGAGEAKFWLNPEIELAKNYRFSKKQIKEIETLIKENRTELVSAWQQYFRP